MGWDRYEGDRMDVGNQPHGLDHMGMGKIPGDGDSLF